MGRDREGKKHCRPKWLALGLYAPATGSPDGLKVAPNASGDHRTKTQRVFQFDQPPDDGLSVRCLRARLTDHRTHLTGRYGDTVPASGECCLADSPHRTHRMSVLCIVRCTPGLFFNRELCPTFTQPSSNFKKTKKAQIGTSMNDLSQTLKFSQIFSLRHSSFYENSQVKAPRSIVWP